LNRLSRAHERYRRQTDGRATANSEREREFTFTKKVSLEREMKERGTYGESGELRE